MPRRPDRTSDAALSREEVFRVESSQELNDDDREALLIAVVDLLREDGGIHLAVHLRGDRRSVIDDVERRELGVLVVDGRLPLVEPRLRVLPAHELQREVVLDADVTVEVELFAVVLIEINIEWTVATPVHELLLDHILDDLDEVNGDDHESLRLVLEHRPGEGALEVPLGRRWLESGTLVRHVDGGLLAIRLISLPLQSTLAHVLAEVKHEVEHSMLLPYWAEKVTKGTSVLLLS